MNRQGAIAEIDWYRSLVERKLRLWGGDLREDLRHKLLDNIERVASKKDALVFMPDKQGYYIGEVDEEGLRHGYGIYTRTTNRSDRWTMQAGEWVEERPYGSHTLYEADCPEEHCYLAAMHFKGRRRSERGTIGITLSERGIDTRIRKYRQWEGFSLSTLIFGAIFIYILSLVIIRNAKLSLFVVAGMAILYTIGALRGRQ